jgi:hypothetical protein
MQGVLPEVIPAVYSHVLSCRENVGLLKYSIQANSRLYRLALEAPNRALEARNKRLVPESRIASSNEGVLQQPDVPPEIEYSIRLLV